MPQIKVNIKSFEEGTQFQPPSDAFHNAVLADIIELPQRQSMYGVKDELIFLYILAEKDDNGKNKDVIQFVNNNFFRGKGKESNLVKLMDTLLGRQSTEADAENLDALIGSYARVVTEQYESKKDGKLKAKVTGVRPPVPGKEVLIPKDFVRDYQKPVDERLATRLGANTAQLAKPSGTAVAKSLLKPAVDDIFG